MKKLAKVLAVVLAIALLACPFASAAFVDAGADNDALKVEIVDETDKAVRVTVESKAGFVAAQGWLAVTGVTRDKDEDNQDKDPVVYDYSVLNDTFEEDGYVPSVDVSLVNGVLSFIVTAADSASLAKYAKVIIDIPVILADDFSVTATKFVAGDDVENKETFIEIGFTDENGVINTEDPNVQASVTDEDLEPEIIEDEIIYSDYYEADIGGYAYTHSNYQLKVGYKTTASSALYNDILAKYSAANSGRFVELILTLNGKEFVFKNGSGGIGSGYTYLLISGFTLDDMATTFDLCVRVTYYTNYQQANQQKHMVYTKPVSFNINEFLATDTKSDTYNAFIAAKAADTAAEQLAVVSGGTDVVYEISYNLNTEKMTFKYKGIAGSSFVSTYSSASKTTRELYAVATVDGVEFTFKLSNFGTGFSTYYISGFSMPDYFATMSVKLRAYPGGKEASPNDFVDSPNVQTFKLADIFASGTSNLALAAADYAAFVQG